jgi:hypothetical protein
VGSLAEFYTRFSQDSPSTARGLTCPVDESADEVFLVFQAVRLEAKIFLELASHRLQRQSPEHTHTHTAPAEIEQAQLHWAEFGKIKLHCTHAKFSRMSFLRFLTACLRVASSTSAIVATRGPRREEMVRQIKL